MAMTVVGLFDSYASARDAADALKREGIREEDISLVANQSAYESAGTGTDEDTNNDGVDNSRAAADGAGAGATMGAVAGGTAGLLAGLGLIAIPGFGPVVAAGWLISALTGAGIGAAAGAAIGGLAGALTSAGVPEEEAGYYAEGVRRGGTLLTIRAEDDLAHRAAEVMDRYGAVDIDERADYYRSSGYTGYNADTQPFTSEEVQRDRDAYATYAPNRTREFDVANVGTAGTATLTNRDINAGGETVIPVVEEEIQVGKRQTQGGGARVHTHVVERPVTETINLREEHVNVERRPVDRMVSASDAAAFREGTIEVTETSEVPVVAKEARVVEEVVISKDVNERTETVQDTVRRTEVDVDELTGTSRTTNTGATATTDTRGVGEKIADAVTGDRIDDKTGRVVR
jgi:uncharacterized protein (TIGR02271 family)